MSNFDLTFCKVYVNVKGWPGINLGASHESGTHPTKYPHCITDNQGLVMG